MAAASSPRRLGDYLLVERVGEGGMAEVFRAEYVGPAGGGPPGSTGPVVVKRIRPELIGQPEFPIFQQMFLNEARLVKRLSHPNLARVFDLQQTTDERTGQRVSFIVGEYVQGRDLWSLMRVATGGFSGRGVALPIAAYIVREVARGLGHAHAHSDRGRPAPIIHRDVSPENILVSRAGEVKVIDFGVAKALGGFGPQTRTGIIKGKLSYMAPEQVSQKALPATDVFGAGIVLHELLTGRRLFGGENDFLVVQRVLKAQIPPPGRLLPGAIPAELDRIVMQALERGLQRRYRDGNVLADALSDAMQRVPALRGGSARALVEWMRQIEEEERQAGGALPPPRGSDLQVDVDLALRAVAAQEGQGRQPTIDLALEDLLFGPAGEGPVDPGIHAAVTQAMRTLPPDLLPAAPAPPPAPGAAPLPGMPAPRPPARSHPQLLNVVPLPAANIPGSGPGPGPGAAPPSGPQLPRRSDPSLPPMPAPAAARATTRRSARPGVPLWMMALLGALSVVVLALLLLLLLSR